MASLLIAENGLNSEGSSEKHADELSRGPGVFLPDLPGLPVYISEWEGRKIGKKKIHSSGLGCFGGSSIINLARDYTSSA